MLRKKYNDDEVLAWNEFRRITDGIEQVQVTSYLHYDDPSFSSSRRSRGDPRAPPGPDWTSRVVKEGDRNRTHWISPIRRIEFTRYTEACEFERLRKNHNNDEVLAWNVLRSTLRLIHVATPTKYDGEVRGSKGILPRPSEKDESSNGPMRRTKVGREHQGTSSPPALDPSNSDDDMVGWLPSESAPPVASTMTQPLVGKSNGEVESPDPPSDDEEINAWIWKSCRKGKTSTVNTKTPRSR